MCDCIDSQCVSRKFPATLLEPITLNQSWFKDEAGQMQLTLRGREAAETKVSVGRKIQAQGVLEAHQGENRSVDDPLPVIG